MLTGATTLPVRSRVSVLGVLVEQPKQDLFYGELSEGGDSPQQDDPEQEYEVSEYRVRLNSYDQE